MIKISKLNEIKKNMTGNTKNVYEAVPMLEYWDINKIFSEIKRSGKNIPMGIVQKELEFLVSSGVALKSGTNRYILNEVKQEDKKEIQSKKDQADVKSLFIKLSKNISDVETIVSSIKNDLSAINEEFEFLKLIEDDNSEAIEEFKSKAEKYDQLQALLNR